MGSKPLGLNNTKRIVKPLIILVPFDNIGYHISLVIQLDLEAAAHVRRLPNLYK